MVFLIPEMMLAFLLLGSLGLGMMWLPAIFSSWAVFSTVSFSQLRSSLWFFMVARVLRHPSCIGVVLDPWPACGKVGGRLVPSGVDWLLGLGHGLARFGFAR